MFKNCLLSAIRNLIRYRMFTFLNIFGLSIGIGVCVLIFIYVRFETSFDTYHPDYKRIYRIEKISNIYNTTEKYAAIPAFIADEIRQYEEVEYLGRFGSWRPQVVRYEDRIYKEPEIHYADPDLFNIFGIQVIEGNPAENLDRPFTIVLTRTVAQKYFGEQSGLGKLIQLDTNYFEVVGIVKDFPWNTHARLDVIFSYSSLLQLTEMPEEVRIHAHMPTYVKLYPWVDVHKFGERIYNIAHDINPEMYEQRGEDMKCVLRPVKDIHLHAEQLKWEVDPGGNPVFIYLISIVGLLVLLITCFNFINLSTARYASRSMEVGIRKTIGASRQNLIIQFLGESLGLVLISHIVGMFLVEFTLPLLNKTVNLNLNLDYFDPAFLIFITAIVLLIGILSGSYPAFFLSSFQPVSVLKGFFNKHQKGILMRRILVLGQYVISIALIIATMIVYKQLLYMKNSPYGFIKENKLVIEFPEGQVTPENYQHIKDEFRNHPGIRAATISSSVPGRWRYYWRMWPSGEGAEKTRMLNCLQVDYDFIPVYGLELIAGHAFDPNLSDSTNRGYILNEAALKAWDWESPEIALTKTINEYKSPVKGVFKDYHFKGLQNPIEPLGMFLIDEDYRYITLVFEERAVKEVMVWTKARFKEFFPDGVYDYFFLDEDFERQYMQEERISRLVLIFSLIGIIIASLGLIGMVSFSLENRRKEIGLRKASGANVVNIYNLLLGSFSKQIVIAFIIACPIAWFGSRAWLNDFAYRTNLNWWIFIVAGLVAWLFAVITISFRSLKAASENPVKALRYE
jgi:putative ABC transport system permease protein